MVRGRAVPFPFLVSRMSVGRLITFFSMFTKIPVYVEDVRDQMVEMGIQDEITLVPMDVPPQHLLGMLVRYRESGLYGNTKNCALVFYNENVSRDVQRLVCCKELMHLFDNQSALTNSRDDFYALIDGVIDLSKALNGPLGAAPQSILDHLALVMGLAVLFPHEIRDDVIAAHNASRMSVGDIAEEFDIPAQYVPFLLTKEWDSLRETLLKL